MAATTGTTEAAPSVTPPRTRLPLSKGHYGLMVATLQERLAWLGYPTPRSARGAFGTTTRAAVKAFQSKNWLTPTGTVDRRTWRILTKQSTPVGQLPKACTSVRMALCIDKTASVLRLVRQGKVTLTTDARFGRPGMETDEGVFRIHEKSYNHTSSIYGSYMPRAMFFNGDEAVHYSPDFAAYGYLHGSHGCVGVRDLAVATRLFNTVPVGTRVVVYWS
ncbi:MAG: L,D-transpeptidase family protein [Actinomycetales bacterium]|nr:L,D-transpeptidase family protein [Actinomycetales bacterium]